MSNSPYSLGTSEKAARRLALQDRQFETISETLLDGVALRPIDRVVELGAGAGSFSRRILRRLGPEGTLVAVDFSAGLLEQAERSLAGVSPARTQFVLGDIRETGRWLDGADVVVGRTVLHHLTLPEVLLGELCLALRPGTRVGFLEPEFRVLLGRLAALERRGRSELAPLRRWVAGICAYYQARQLTPGIGASLARTLEAAGYCDVRTTWFECPMDALALENLGLYYDEVRAPYEDLGILSPAEIDADQRLIAALDPTNLPAVWGMYSVTARVP